MKISCQTRQRTGLILLNQDWHVISVNEDSLMATECSIQGVIYERKNVYLIRSDRLHTDAINRYARLTIKSKEAGYYFVSVYIT